MRLIVEILRYVLAAHCFRGSVSMHIHCTVDLYACYVVDTLLCTITSLKLLSFYHSEPNLEHSCLYIS